MNILLIGSGGREHALVWKLSQSPLVERLLVAPGNGGTAQVPKAENVAIPATEIVALRDLALAEGVVLTIVGPEEPLVRGIVDEFQTAGLAIFGPSQAAAQLEGSKAFAKMFMAESGIPTATARTYSKYRDAIHHVMLAQELPVIKVSGLAAGKGVYVPDCFNDAEVALHEIFVEKRFGEQEVVIEERLEGPELSVLALCDGSTYRLMPAAQDHKRLEDEDKGPNTGGMGAFAPSTLATPALLEEIEARILRPTLHGMALRGTPFVGVLYAGLMLTGDGPKVLEFNCRFGDPETQVILPLLESDLAEILLACAQSRLADLGPLRWRDGAAATVVLASQGYPGSYSTGHPIAGLDEAAALPDVIPFHAGTLATEAGTVTAGGRVLSVSGVGDTLDEALARAYEGVEKVSFEGAVWRSDIGRRG